MSIHLIEACDKEDFTIDYSQNVFLIWEAMVIVLISYDRLMAFMDDREWDDWMTEIIHMDPCNLSNRNYKI